MALIFVASSVPGTQLPAGVWDKAAHLMVYAALGVFFMLPLSGGRTSGVTMFNTGVAIVLSFLYGVSDELHQTFTPGRTADVFDVVADTLGAAAGAVGVFLIAAMWRRLRPNALEVPRASGSGS